MTKIYEALSPTKFAEGDGETRRFSVARSGDKVVSADIKEIRKIDWQGDKLMYPTPRTNLLVHSNDLLNPAWRKIPVEWEILPEFYINMNIFDIAMNKCWPPSEA